MKACSCRFDAALKVEQRYFTQILQTTEAFSMIRSLFISMQELSKGARRPAGVEKSVIKKVGIVGAGFMGASIGYVTAAAGIDVVLIDRDMEAANKGKATFRRPRRRRPEEGPHDGRKRAQHCSHSSRQPLTMPISPIAISSLKPCSKTAASRRL